MLNFQFNINDVIKIPVNKEEKKENNINNDNNTNILGLESHYNKNEDGNIYKYKIMYLLGKLAVFNDGQKHSKTYSDHDFIKDGNINNDIAFKEMSNNNNFIDAQIIFEENSKIVRLYTK